MWWFQQEWASAAWEGDPSCLIFLFWVVLWSDLLAISAVIWSVLDGVSGVAFATTFTDIATLWLMMGSMVLLGRKFGLSLLVFRDVSFHGVTAVSSFHLRRRTWGCWSYNFTYFMGIVLPSNHSSKESRRYGIGFAVCMALQGLKDPYLVFILPVFAIFIIIFSAQRKKMIVPFVGGLVLMALVGVLLRSTSGSYRSIRPSGLTESKEVCIF